MNNSLVPSSIRSIRTLSIEKVLKRLNNIDFNILLPRNFLTVKKELLQDLAFELQMDDFISGEMEEDKIRQFLMIARLLHQKKGTPFAVKRALEVVGIKADLTEWWQVSPRAPAGTFEIKALVNENFASADKSIFNPAKIVEARRLIDIAKRKSQHYTFKIGSEHEAKLFIGMKFNCYQKLNMRGNII